MMASTRPNALKMGVKLGARVAVFDAPAGYGKIIGPLPIGATFEEEATRRRRYAVVRARRGCVPNGPATYASVGGEVKRLGALPETTEGEGADDLAGGCARVGDRGGIGGLQRSAPSMKPGPATSPSRVKGRLGLKHALFHLRNTQLRQTQEITASPQEHRPQV